MTGINHPKRMNDEDEARPLGVIAHHVATSGHWIMNPIQGMLGGRPLPPVDFRQVNAKHADEHADVTQEAVLAVLRESAPRLAAAVRAIPDDQLDQSRDTPAGPMSTAQRVEMVLIGHIPADQGSIEATKSPDGASAPTQPIGGVSFCGPHVRTVKCACCGPRRFPAAGSPGHRFSRPIFRPNL